MARSALLIVDMINAFDFEGAAALLDQARRMWPKVVRLKERAKAARVPVIYCNDNFGDWRSDFKAVITACTREDKPARDLVQSVAPGPGDYFLLKPKHSAFFETPLESLLKDLKVRRLILCGIAGDGCIHSTATDAHIREFAVIVVRDGTASPSAARNRNALRHLETTRYAKLSDANRVRFSS